jgi:hypothetical protein
MRVFVALSLVATVGMLSCAPADDAPRKKTTAEEAAEAGFRARKKAEELKKQQEQKAKEAVESTQD